MKRQFPTKTLQCLVEFGQVGTKHDGLTVVSNEITGHGRWSVYHEMVFEADGQFWLASYSVGATENQDEYPFDLCGDTVECEEVVRAEKTVVVYVPVPEEE